MKLMKKFSKGIIAVVVCLLLATTAWAANEINVTYQATLDTPKICVNELEKSVVLTVKASHEVVMDAFTAQVKAPEGLEITGIANDVLKFTEEDHFNLENGKMMWYDENNIENDLLATVTVKVPAGTSAGEYTIDFEIIDISRDWGTPWEDGTVVSATLTVVEHADGDDADHLCDTCQGEVEGADCVFAPGEPVWSADNKTVTVTGTCVCGETVTATADAASEVTSGTCQTPEITTYTATFTESWITEKTVTKEVEGAKDPSNHVGEQTTTYTNNGDDHTVIVTCACGAEISRTNEPHSYDETTNKCVCGAEKPEEPTDPDPSEPVEGEGLKGDVNLDGEIDMADLVAMARHIGEVEEITDAQGYWNADLNGDGEIGMDDLVKLAQFVGEVIDSLE